MKIKEYVELVKTSLVSKFENYKHHKWEFLKCGIRKFMVGYPKNNAKIKREKNSFLENKIKELEQNLNDEKIKSQQSNFKDELNDISESSQKRTSQIADMPWVADKTFSPKYDNLF